jgi:hypothetical protein
MAGVASPLRACVLATLLVAACSGDDAPAVPDLLGRDPHEALPGWDGAEQGGAVLDDAHAAEFRTSPDGRVVLLLSRKVATAAGGSAVYTVVAAADGGALGSDSYVAIGECADRSGAELADVIGVADGTDPYWNPAISAWRIDVEDERIVPIEDVAGITCWTGNPD